MKRVAGILALLIALYALLFWSNPNASGSSNLIDLANRQGFYGVMTLGVGVLMISGGIDLSIGSVVALGAVLFGWMMQKGVHPYAAMAATVGVGCAIGVIHGLLVTGLRLQAFLVTLCGLFVYRGLARLLTDDREVGIIAALREHPEFKESLESLRYLLVGKDSTEELVFPATLVVFLVLTLVVGAVLHRTVHGRYWYAIGYNQQAARYAGVRVNAYRVAVFILCSALAAFAGTLLLLFYGSAKPDNAGQAYELEAITGAVLGGVSLRGGEGTAIGMVLGAAVLPLLRNLVTFLEIPNAVIPAVIGVTLLVGTIVDEVLRRRNAARG